MLAEDAKVILKSTIKGASLMRLLSLHSKDDMFIAVIGRIAFYATFWVRGRVFNIMKMLYLDPCLKIGYTLFIGGKSS